MKKIMWVMLSAILLTACSGNTEEGAETATPKMDKEVSEVAKQEKVDEEVSEAAENEKVDEETDELNEVTPSSKPTIDEEQLREVIDYNMLGEGDSLIRSSIVGKELQVTVELGESILDPGLRAPGSYSALSDELLTYGGWEVLTVEFVSLGTVSMNRNEKETNELGDDYFPVAKIEEKLKGN